MQFWQAYALGTLFVLYLLARTAALKLPPKVPLAWSQSIRMKPLEDIIMPMRLCRIQKIMIHKIQCFTFSGDGQDYDYEIGGSFGDTGGPDVQLLPTTFTVTQTVFATGDTIL